MHGLPGYVYQIPTKSSFEVHLPLPLLIPLSWSLNLWTIVGHAGQVNLVLIVTIDMVLESLLTSVMPYMIALLG